MGARHKASVVVVDEGPAATEDARPALQERGLVDGRRDVGVLCAEEEAHGGGGGEGAECAGELGVGEVGGEEVVVAAFGEERVDAVGGDGAAEGVDDGVVVAGHCFSAVALVEHGLCFGDEGRVVGLGQQVLPCLAIRHAALEDYAVQAGTRVGVFAHHVFHGVLTAC